MLTSIKLTQLYVLDQDQALDFYVGTLGFEVHSDVDLGFMRWLTICLPGQPEREILLEVPGPPALSPDVAAQVRDALTKGAAGGWISLTTDDAFAMADELRSKGVEFTDEPSQKPYGVDFGIRDPFGNKLRIGQLFGG
jgi:catechol 2,3-dioxygenase-like lactoylglutathione lyase family enzyme